MSDTARLTAYLAPLEARTWESLTQLPMASWLWIDLAPKAVRLERALAERPREASHLWGWSDTDLVRARLDSDLPGEGIVGARLSLVPVVDAEEVDVTTSVARTWSSSEGLVAVTYPPGLSDHQDVTLYEVRRAVQAAGTDDWLLTHLVFMRLGSRT